MGFEEVILSTWVTLGTIQVLRQQRGGWVGLAKSQFLLIYTVLFMHTVILEYFNIKE